MSLKTRGMEAWSMGNTSSGAARHTNNVCPSPERQEEQHENKLLCSAGTPDAPLQWALTSGSEGITAGTSQKHLHKGDCRCSPDISTPSIRFWKMQALATF